MEHLYVWRWRETIIQLQVPNISSVNSEAESLTNKWLWHLLATVLPSSFLTAESHPDLTITCVWHLYCEPELQPLIHGGNTAMLTHSHYPHWDLCLYHRAPNSFLKSTERINIKVCQIPTELTVNIVTVTQDRNLAVMKLKREMLLWMKNKYVTCYDNDNHGLKVIVEHQSMFMMITTSDPEPDKRFPNSKF